MTDVVVDISKLRTIPDSCDYGNNCRYYWSFYRSWIIFGIILLTHLLPLFRLNAFNTYGVLTARFRIPFHQTIRGGVVLLKGL